MLIAILFTSIFVPLAVIIVCLCITINKSSKLLEDKVLSEYKDNY